MTVLPGHSGSAGIWSIAASPPINYKQENKTQWSYNAIDVLNALFTIGNFSSNWVESYGHCDFHVS